MTLWLLFAESREPDLIILRGPLLFHESIPVMPSKFVSAILIPTRFENNEGFEGVE